MPNIIVYPGADVNVTLKPTFSVGETGDAGAVGSLHIADVLPRGLRYLWGSTTGVYGNSNVSYEEPLIIEHATDVDCNTYAPAIVAEGHPCGTLNGGTGDESILFWDLGLQAVGTDYGDLVFRAAVSIDSPNHEMINYAEIESPLDLGPSTRRVDDAAVTNAVPLSLLSVKDVRLPKHEVNTDSLLDWVEYTIGVRNGSNDALTDLEILDIVPFSGDGVLGSYTFTPEAGGTTYDEQRDPPTDYQGTFRFVSMNFDNNGECDDANIEYWYTNYTGVMDISPETNTIGGAIAWCQGTSSGPDVGCGYSNDAVTATRVRKIDMGMGAICYLKLKFATQNNAGGNRYSNSASAKATGVVNAVMTNTAHASVFSSSIGNRVWQDENQNGIQDAGENGIEDIEVKLYDDNHQLLSTTHTNGSGEYLFPGLKSANYIVEIVVPSGYMVSPKDQGSDDKLDSDIDMNTHKTDVITLGEDKNRVDIDAALYKNQVPTKIMGNIYDDGNGDNRVNGNGTGTADGIQLYVTLLDSSNAVVASRPVAVNGSYVFDDADGVVLGSSYTMVLGTTQNGTTAALPEDWNNADGENINSTSTGNDGTPDGKLSIVVADNSVTGADFGINKKPMAADVDSGTRRNPIGDIRYSVPNLQVSDLEDGTPTTVTISNIPESSMGVLYYDGSLVVEGKEILDFDIDKLAVDPVDGCLTVLFMYTTTDASGTESNPANVGMPFTDISHIGDYFWIDTNSNGLQDTEESPLVSARVELLDGDGNKLYWTDADKTDLATTVTEYPAEETTTANEGKYGFDVHPGDYQLKFTIPDDMLKKGYGFGPQNQGDDTLDTDANENGVVVLKVDAGENDFTIDAGVACGCASVSSDSADALNSLSFLAMLLLLLLNGLVIVRRDRKVFDE